jgi:hypothetical protein
MNHLDPAILIGYKEQKCLQPRANKPRLRQYDEVMSCRCEVPPATWSLMSAHRIRPIDVNDKPRPSAQYIGELTRELARFARTDGCETLSYLLELATIEAELMGGLPEGQSLS